MCEFHYKHIKRKYNANLLFIDTGQFSLWNWNRRCYEDFYEDKSLFDSSGHFFILSVKKLLVTWKINLKKK